MKLTKRKAIELSIELWAWLAETGLRKYDYFEKRRGNIPFLACFLCEYDKQHGGNCSNCPFYKRYGHCMESYYCKWCMSDTEADRKKYATEFLAQLKELLQ